MIDVPPPTRISTPFTPSRSRARNATSWIPVIARSSSDPEKAVFILRGIAWVVWCRTKYRAYAAAYGVRSKISSSHTPANGSPVTLRTVLPQPSRDDRPDSEALRISAAAWRSGMWWIWMFWRVVMWPLLSGAHSSTTSANISICSGVTPPIGSLIRIIWTSAWRWPYTPCFSRNLMNSSSSI